MLVFIKSIFSENGEGSYSRLASFIITLAVLIWVSHVVYKTHAIPDLGGASAFIATGVGVHYGINKADDIMDTYKNGQTPPNKV